MWKILYYYYCYLGFIPHNVKQPLQGMEIKGKQVPINARLQVI